MASAVLSQKRAAIYCRFSPRPDAAETESLQVQLERCTAYAALAGLRIVETYAEPETSAGTPLAQRSEGAKLLAAIASKQIDAVLVQRVDRLSRDTADCLTCARAWNKIGVALHLCDQGGNSIDCSTAMGEFMLTQLLAFATFERGIIRERTSGAMRRHQASGRRMGSVVPYGWKVDPSDPARIIEDDLERAVIAWAWSQREGGISLRQIARELQEDETPCRGGAWSHGTIKSILRRASHG